MNTLSYRLNPQSAPGNKQGSGQATQGRYGVTLSTPAQSNSRRKCRKWIQQQRQNNDIVDYCRSCPRNFRQVNKIN